MQEITDDAPLVPYITDPTIRTDGGRKQSTAMRYERPPETSYTTEYTRDEAEIEPMVADLR